MSGAGGEHGPRGSILFIGNFLSARGWNRHVCEDLADRLAQRGWRVRRASDRPGRVAKALDMVRAVVTRPHEYGVAHVDVYSGAAFGWAELACLALRQKQKPYVLTLHGGSLPQFAREHPGRVARLLRSARCVTTPSGYLRQAVRGIRDDIALVPNAIDVHRYPPRPPGPARPLLVWVRAFQDVYNPMLAPRVAALLGRDFPEVRLRMVGADKGDGSLERTRRVARELGVEDRVEIIPGVPKEQVPAQLEGSDVFLNTTRVDNTPVSVIEAMARGLCVVSTDVGGIPHLVQDGRDGLLVPSDDAVAMAGAVRRVLTSPALAAELGRSARRKAEGFDWEPVLDRWEEIFSAAGRGVSRANGVRRRAAADAEDGK